MSDISSQYFKYFLTQTSTGLIYYVNSMGELKTGSIYDEIDYSLPEHPDGWMDFEIKYVRNPTYWGINRSFTVPLNFIGDGAFIIRSLFYNGKGIEQPITLVITKWNDEKGFFELYYKGQLDLSQNNNAVATSVSVNIMEGGILQLFKSYENTVIEIPVDGSIPENIKVLADGLKFNDTLHYQILKTSSPYPGLQPLPMVYVSNDGDNIGVVHGDQNLELPYANYESKSANFAYSNISPSVVRIRGTISIKSDPGNTNTQFYLIGTTSLQQPRAGGGRDHTVGLTLPQNPGMNNIFLPIQSQVTINGQSTYFFDETMILDANENLFVEFFNQFAPNGSITILGGTLSISFNSKLPVSRVWGIKAYDVWKIIGRKLNALASTSDYPFNYQFTSELLQQYLNIVITSGDAIRASTDPNYFQYYNLQTLNPQNPNNTDYTQFSSIGPVIKITIGDFFKFINTVLYAAIGNQLDENGKDSIFIESRKYVLDASVVTYACPQVNNLRISVALDYYFNWLKIGYSPNDYDETSGKYEYNNTSQYQAPIKTLAKILEIISPIRTDSFGFDFKRYNTQGGKSITFNSDDTSKWGLDIDFSKSSFDFYKASYRSSILNTQSTANTNIKLIHGMNYQPIQLSTFDGEYFLNGLDFAIFMFNQPGSLSRNITTHFEAVINGLPGDTATVKMWYNGAVIQQWTKAITAVNTAFTGDFNSNVTTSFGDNIYFTVDLVRTCTITFNAFSLNVGAGYFICQLGGPLSFNAGATQQLISLPVITAQTLVVAGNTIQVVSYGFQYFRFLSNVQDRVFNWFCSISAFIKGNPSQTVTFTLWRNGQKIGEQTYAGTAAQTTINQTEDPQFEGQDTESNYDTYWITANCGDVDCWIYQTYLLFQSASIKAYPFNRPVFNNVSGIPNPESAFNIFFSPARRIQQWKSYLASCLSMIGAGTLQFQTADKNQFLSTTDINGVTITENASIDIHDFGTPDFLPLVFDFDTSVSETAKKLFDFSANGYISFIYKNKTFYGFPLEVSIKPAMKDVQSWKLLAAPANNLNDLIELDWDGIISLNFLDAMIPYICPLHFVPLNFSKNAKYNTKTMDEDWFKNRVTDYINHNNYFAPWENGDTISLQCQTNGLSPVTVEVYKANGQSTGTIINIPQVQSDAILSPQLLYQGDISLATFAAGKYYFVWRMGIGAAQAQFISEGIHVKAKWPKTILCEYSNTRNKLAVIFNAVIPYRPSIRMRAQINTYVPKSKFTTFVNEPQDIKLQNAIPYDTWNLEFAFDEGMPDYMSRKIERIHDLDTVLWDEEQYTREENAQLEIRAQKGTPKVYATLNIRLAYNRDGLTVNTANQIEGPQQAGYVIDAQAFGQDGTTGENLINVTRQ